MPELDPAPRRPKNDAYVQFRLRESLRDKSQQECHIIDAYGIPLGILPATKITTVVDYNKGYPVVTIELIGENVSVETHRIPR